MEPEFARIKKASRRLNSSAAIGQVQILLKNFIKIEKKEESEVLALVL